MRVSRFLFPSRHRSLATLKEISGQPIRRKQPCRFCGEKQGYFISDIAFWDVADTRLVICPRCRLAQLDPMLSQKAMSTGVYAYYLMQKAGESEKSRLKNCARNFRKGYAFALGLPKGFKPAKVLELGPGDGFFLRGVRSVFPEAKFYAWDIVPEVARAMQDEHGFSPLSGGFEKLKTKEKFDLIIARDVIEHFAETGHVLQQVENLLQAGGLFHFITPNGHEDLWKFYVLSRLNRDEKGELLLNHVNYFDGAGLHQYLRNIGLNAVEYYTYDFSSWKMGIGWIVIPKLAANRIWLSAKETISKFKRAGTSVRVQAPRDARIGLLQRLWFRYKYWRLIKLAPAYNFGHEIHGLYRKS